MANLQPAQLGAYGVFPQTALGADPGAVDYYWFRGNLFDHGPQQQLRDLGNLVGGSLLPGGQVKTGVFSGGRAVMPPALDDFIGWILYAFAGDNEATPDDNSGSYTHYFPDKTAGDTVTPSLYLATHRILPTDGDDMGEQFLDQTVTRIQLGYVGGEFVTFQADFLGKRPTFVMLDGGEGDGWDITTNPGKGKLSVPISALPDSAVAGENAIQLPVGTNLEGAQAVTVDLVNTTPAYAAVAQVGSFDPHSWPVLNRVPVITVRQLYHSAELYKSAFYSPDGTWNPAVWNDSLQISGQSASWIGAERTMALALGEVDTKQTDVAYTGTEIGLDDSGQDFSDYAVTPPALATHRVAVYDAAGILQSWGYCGSDDTLVKIEVYKDRGTTIRGWVLDGSAGTPDNYKVFLCDRYEVGVKAMSVDFEATAPVLAGGDLMRVDFIGRLADAEVGLDWYMWLKNRTADYAWPT